MQAVHRQALQKRLVEPAVERGEIHHAFGHTGGRKRQAVTVQRPQHGDQRRDGETLHHDREHVLGPHHAGVKQRQARDGHKQHQNSRCQHPGGITGIESRCRRGGGRSLFAESQHRQCRQQYDAQDAEQLFQMELRKHGLFSCIKAHLCRFHRCGCARPVRGQRQKSCRRRFYRCAPIW